MDEYSSSRQELRGMKKISWVVIGIGALILWIGLKWTQSMLTFQKKATLVEATVTVQGFHPDNGSDQLCYPTISFSVKGKTHTYTHQSGSDSACFSKGKKVKTYVYRDPKGKWQASFYQPVQDWLVRIVVIFFGVVFLGCGIVLWKVTNNTQEMASVRAPGPDEQ